MDDRAFWTLWAVGVLLALAFWGTVAFVALHFLLKVW